MPKIHEKRLQNARKLVYNLNHNGLMRSPNLGQDECAEICTKPNNQANQQHLDNNTVNLISRLRQDLHHSREEGHDLRRKLKAALNIQCPVCYSTVEKNQVIYLADCGHGACKNCFVQSVVNSALQLKDSTKVATIDDNWRCFLCRKENKSFCCFHGELLLVRDISRRTNLRKEVKNQYREQLNSRRVAVVHPLPPLNNHAQQSEDNHQNNETQMIINDNHQNHSVGET